jgi:hypothetical protein
VAREPDLAAEVGLTGDAHRAASARDRGIDRDPATDLGAGLHDADELVAEYEGTGEDSIPYAALDEPVTVGAAEAYGGHAYEHLTVSGARRRLLV